MSADVLLKYPVVGLICFGMGAAAVWQYSKDRHDMAGRDYDRAKSTLESTVSNLEKVTQDRDGLRAKLEATIGRETTLAGEVRDLKEELAGVKGKPEKLAADLATLRGSRDALIKENARLKDEIARLRAGPANISEESWKVLVYMFKRGSIVIEGAMTGLNMSNGTARQALSHLKERRFADEQYGMWTLTPQGLKFATDNNVR